MHRVLVTGSTGFLGSHLVQSLCEKGYSVATIIRPESSLHRLQPCLNSLKIIRGSLNNLTPIKKALTDFRADTVFHCAWQGVASSQRNDSVHFEVNFPSSLELLKLAGEWGANKWIGLGSQSEYGPHRTECSETESLAPADQYSKAKVATCEESARLAKKLEIDFVWFRLFAVYGPEDNEHFLIPQITKKLLKGEKPLLTHGLQRWDYLYVADAVGALIAAALTPGLQGVFNLGSGKSNSVRSIVEKIRDLINPALSLGFDEIASPPGMPLHLKANIQKLQEALSWSPSIPLEAGLRATIESMQAQRGRGRQYPF